MDQRLVLEDELHGYYFEDLAVGMTEIYAKTITDADIVTFAGISGDTNPVHINQEFAVGTRFKGRIAHGLLIASFISTVIGTKLPGPGCIYLDQTLNFKAPVVVGDTVKARVTISRLIADKHFAELDTVCTVGDRVVIDGQALVLVTSRRLEKAS